MCKKIKDWLIKKTGWTAFYVEDGTKEAEEAIHLLGGFTEKDALELMEEANKMALLGHEKLAERLTTVQSELRVDPKFGYTPDNVIEASKAQTMFNLGRAVYPYAKHFVTEDGLYICSVEVLEAEEE